MTDRRSPEMEARSLDAAAAHRSGRTLQQIADGYRCSRERARQLCLRGEELKLERELRVNNPWYELPDVMRNALQRDGCKPDIDAVVQHYPTLTELQRVPAMGNTRIGHLQSWLRKHGKGPIR